MTTLRNAFLTCGAEIEIANDRSIGYRAVSEWHSLLHNNGFNWVKVESDATSGVDAEIITPPFSPYSTQAKNDIADLMTFISDNGGKVGLQATGGHVHVGVNPWLLSDFNIDDSYGAFNNHWQKSKDHMINSGDYLPNPNATPMPFALIKDIVHRYAIHQDEINQIVSRSRRANRFCRSLDFIIDRASATFNGVSTIGGLNSLLGGKFSAINVSTYAMGTIEFRQHQATLDSTKLFNWCRLIVNMFQHSDANRLAYDGGVQSVPTPDNPYRNGSRIGIMWQMMRRDGGVTTRDISSATGWTPDTIRARVSEMRRDHGQSIVICHNQQHYNHAYGSSNGNHDLNGYEIPMTIDQHISEITIRSDDECGVTSIWANMSDNLYEYFNRRRRVLS